MAGKWRIAIVAGMAGVLLACMSGAVHVEQKFPRRGKDYPIYLAEGDIVEPYIVVGTVKTKAYEEWEAQDRGQEELKRWARRMGGDAVLWIKRTPTMTEDFGYVPYLTFRAGSRFQTAYYYTGTVVRFDRSMINTQSQ